MPTYLVKIGDSLNEQVEIKVVGDSPEHARATCLRAGLSVASVNLIPINAPPSDPSDDAIAQVRDELRQLKAALDASSKSLHARTGVGTVVVGVITAFLIILGVAVLLRIGSANSH